MGPWLAAATAVAGTIATVLVAIFSNRSQVRLAETQRQAEHDSREEERLAERAAREEERTRDREARDEERARERDAVERQRTLDQDERTAAISAKRREERRAAVRALIAKEREKATNAPAQNWYVDSQSELDRLAADFMLLTRQHEGSLRQAIRERVQLPSPSPEWWYPWVNEWITEPEDASITAFKDGGGFAF